MRRLALSLLVMGAAAACALGMGGNGAAASHAAAEVQVVQNGVQLRTLVVRPEDAEGVLVVTVVYNERFAAVARETMGAGVTPLVLLISALTPQGASFDPHRLRVAQGGREWTPVVVGEERDLFSLDGQRVVNGLLAANEVRQVVLLLPEWFDISQPMLFSYGSSVKTLRFPSAESRIAVRP